MRNKVEFYRHFEKYKVTLQQAEVVLLAQMQGVISTDEANEQLDSLLGTFEEELTTPRSDLLGLTILTQLRLILSDELRSAIAAE